jgi:hypothetical protein
MDPRLAAGLTTIVGLSMLAGWLSAFRNRGYLGWLGLAFMSMSGYLFAYDRAHAASAFSLPAGGAVLAQKACLAIAFIAFACAVVAAARETKRRIREIQESHRAAEEALFEMMKASAEQDARADSEKPSAESPEQPKADD